MPTRSWSAPTSSTSAATSRGATCWPGRVDVVVTDGFTGNVALKTIEGTALAVAGAVSSAARSNPVAAVGGLLLRPALGGLRREMDPDTTGGAILLGLRGVAVVGHGSSGENGDRQRDPACRARRRGQGGRPDRGAPAALGRDTGRDA